jgi:hypothetical protein
MNSFLRRDNPCPKDDYFTRRQKTLNPEVILPKYENRNCRRFAGFSVSFPVTGYAKPCKKAADRSQGGSAKEFVT